MTAAGVTVTPDDLARGVDAERTRAQRRRGIVEGGVRVAIGVVEEAVLAGGVEVTPDNQARGADAVGTRAERGRGIVEGEVGAVVAVVEEAVGERALASR